MTVENALVGSTMLGEEDHGIFTCSLNIRGEGWGQGFGGYSLDQYDKEKKRRIGTAYGLEFIKRILKTLEIETWEKLPGTPCRIFRAENGLITKIGHLIKDNWFDPADLLKEMP